MAYATYEDVEAGFRPLSPEEQDTATALLDEAAIIIDSYRASAGDDAKKVVSCRMVRRAMGNSSDCSIPIGAMQGSIAALGYSQSWTMGTGSTGELYISSAERRILGMANAIGSYSPVEELAGDCV